MAPYLQFASAATRRGQGNIYCALTREIKSQIDNLTRMYSTSPLLYNQVQTIFIIRCNIHKEAS